MSLEVLGNVSVGGGWMGAILKNSSEKEIAIEMISHSNKDGFFAYPYYGPTSIPAGKIRVVVQECIKGSVDCQIKTTATTIKLHYEYDENVGTKGDIKDIAFGMAEKISNLIGDKKHENDKAELVKAFIELSKMI